MDFRTWALGLLIVYTGLKAVGCSCECETVCAREGRVYNYTTVEMRRSECSDLQEHVEEVREEARGDTTFTFVIDTSCQYRCVD